MKDILKIAGIYIAIIIGAGFASGQEIVQFFIRYGEDGLYGIFIASILFGIIGYAVMDICLIKRYKNSFEFMRGVFGKKFGVIIEYIIAILFLVFYFTMVSASGVALKQVFNFNFLIGVIIMTVICFIILMKDLDGLLKINAILAPIMVIGGIIPGLYILMAQNTSVFLNDSIIINSIKQNFVISAIIYVCYNIVTAIAILTSLKKVVRNRKIAFFSALIASISLLVLGISMGLPLLNNYEFAKNFEMPLLALIYKYIPFMEYIYLIVLVLAIFSTAISNAFAFVNFVGEKFTVDKKYIKIFVCVFGIFASFFGFSNFIAKVYPLFGIIGFVEICFILSAYFKIKTKKMK